MPECTEHTLRDTQAEMLLYWLMPVVYAKGAEWYH